jgi:hypothetical protein
MKPQKPISKYPAFQPNQVLTADALNSAVGYLLQQEQFTRNKLIGIGIVCGLTLEKVNSPLGIIIHDGCGISSVGALGLHIQPRDINNSTIILPYTHARQFKTTDNKFIVGEDDEFKGLTNLLTDPQKAQVRELVTTPEFTANQATKGGAALTAADLTDNVVVLYFDDFLAKTGGCLDENCDEKGMMHELALKPLLIPKTVMDAFLNDGATQKSPERVRYAEFQNDKLNSVNYLRINQLSHNETGRVQLKNINTLIDLQLLFEEAIKGKNPADTTLIQIGQAIAKLRTEFAWLFDAQLRLPVSSYFSEPTGNLFNTNISTAIATNPNRTQIQYAYDFIRDVVEIHNDLYEKISDLMAICCPDEWMYPTHLMLGVVDSAPAIKQFDATKFTNPNLKYRHIFSPAFTDILQRELRDEIYFKIERLNIVLNTFDLNAIRNKANPRVLPSFDYDKDLSQRVIPAYYNNPNNLSLYWNLENTKRNKSSRNSFYDKFSIENEPFRFDWVRNDFFRIEGHIGKTFPAAQTLIDTIRKNNNLPFNIKTVALNVAATTHECAMPDLQEEYDFQRRKVTAVLKRLLKKLIELFKETQLKTPNSEQGAEKFEADKKLLLEFLEKLIKNIQTIIDILKEPCVSKFDYLTIKKIYEQTLFIILEYAQKQDNLSTEDKAANKEAVNLAITAFNLLLFGSLYKIYVALQHRLALMQVNSVDTLRELATKYTGLEHLAGVRRGETFVLVHDAGTVVADFNLPYLIPCECGCVEEDCNNKKPSFVQPIATPMILFVNLVEMQKEKKNERSISFYEEDLLMGDDTIKNIKFDKNQAGTPAFVISRLKFSKNDTELIFSYTPDFKNDPDGWHQVKYILETNQGNAVEGVLFVGIVGGKPAFDIKNIILAAQFTQTSAFKPEMPYTKSQFVSPPQMKFLNGGTITNETVGGTANVQLLQTPTGNTVMISRDAQNYPQFQIFRLNQKPVVEDFEFELEFNGQVAKGKGTLNITSPQTPTAPPITSLRGILLDASGQPIAKARVFNVNKNVEAFTNEKGEYEIAADKAGELILFQKDGFDDIKMQAGGDTKQTMSKKFIKTGLLDNFDNKKLIDMIGKNNLRIK